MNFPLDLRFKLLAISSRIAVRDSLGNLVCYAKQKAFRLKESVTIFADEAQKQPLYTIKADRVIDFSAAHRIDDVSGNTIGVVKRRGMRSLWRASYEVHRDGQQLFAIREANPWTKVLDGLVSEVPLVGLISGYILHPRYQVSRADSGHVVMMAEKRPAFMEGKFRIDSVEPQTPDDERLAVLSLIVMLLHERRRG